MPGYFTGRGKAGGRLLAAAIFGVAAAASPLAADSISYTPGTPNVEQTVSFAYVAASTPSASIRWEFGDGASFVSGAGVTTTIHTYLRAGTYSVRARVMTVVIPSPWIYTSIQVVERRKITFAPPAPLPGAPVTFTAHNFFMDAILWNFGDGRSQSGPRTVTHVYPAAGTYLVRAVDMGGKSQVTISVEVVVGGTAAVPSIAVSPELDIRTNAAVEFRAVNFVSTTLIRWDFGDGTVENDASPPVITHAFRMPGVFTVRAFDNGGAVATASVTVRVLMDRQITMNPAAPRTGEEVTFTALNFLTPALRWEFGDGTVLDPGGTRASHVYATAGPFTVRASEPGGTAQAAAALPMTVYPAQGPRARFTLSYVHLRFEDGKAYKTIPRDFAGLTAFAEIKFEGTGTLQAQWLVDGLPFKTVLTNLAFAGSTIIDSGKMPGLPSVIPGIHDVTLSLVTPQAEFRIPVIRYFVTADPVAAGPVELALSGAEDLEGSLLAGDGDAVAAPAEGPFLVRGVVRNDGGVSIPFALLRVFLNEDLVDQKLVRDLGPGEQRRFESSVPNPGVETKRLVLVLYDISGKPAPVLYYREISVRPAKIDQRMR